MEKTPLHYAIELDHLEDVKTCLKYGADLNIVDNDNQPPLQLSAYREHSDVRRSCWTVKLM